MKADVSGFSYQEIELFMSHVPYDAAISKVGGRVLVELERFPKLLAKPGFASLQH
ncbi:MAG: hypothetical protein ACE5DI_04290 [Candidatus Micrarchaeia archaeon]